MIRSMTGFGRGESRSKYGNIVVEIRTFNHKFFETSFRISEAFSIFEDKIKSYIQRKIKRGRINLSLTYNRIGEGAGKITVDKRLAFKYRDILVRLRKELRLKDDIGVSQIIAFPNVITYEEPKEDVVKLWPSIEEALSKAVDRLIKLKEAGGRALSKDFKKRINKIADALFKIENRAPIVVREYKKRLAKKIRDFSSQRAIDEIKLEEEVAIFDRNCDFTEEVTLMKSHLKNFKSTLAKKENEGRVLDFIAQELHREANTIGAKTSDFNISQRAIKIKSEIEKIREQVQNVE